MTVFLTLATIFAVFSWSESQSTSALAKASLDHGSKLASQAEAKLLRQFERQVESLQASMNRLSLFAVSTLALSFAAVLLLWLPPRVEEAPNKAPEPTPGSVTPRATEGDAK